ncbi:MAG: hypothetical protein WKF53_16260 [Rubrobacter sp.]
MLGLFGPKSDKTGAYRAAFVYQVPFKKDFSTASRAINKVVFGKWRKDKELANTVFGSFSTLPAANGTGTIATRTPYSFASGVLLKSNMPATIAETVFITNDKEGQLLSNGTGARQQEIAEALRVGIDDYLTTH